MKKTLLLVSLMLITPLVLGDSCDPLPGVENVNVLAAATPGGCVKVGGNKLTGTDAEDKIVTAECLDEYIIPPSKAYNIWYKGKCRRIENLSHTKELIVPTKDGQAFKDFVNTNHPFLKCVGSMKMTKDKSQPSANNPDCHRGVRMKITDCTPVEQIVRKGSCDPGCWYNHTWETTEDVVDADGNVISSNTVSHSEVRYFGAGAPCTYQDTIEHKWTGNPVITDFTGQRPSVQIDYLVSTHSRNCTRPVPACEGSSGAWVCRTCGPGPGPGGCTYTGGEHNDATPGDGGPGPTTTTAKSGGTTVSH